MAKKEKKIPFRIFVIDGETGEKHNWADLSEEQLAHYEQKMAENSSRIMSNYYSGHLDQFERL